MHSTIIEYYNTNKHKFNNDRSSEIIQIVSSLYNDTIHSATSYTPNEIIFNQGEVDSNEITENANKIFTKFQNNFLKQQKILKNTTILKKNHQM